MDVKKPTHNSSPDAYDFTIDEVKEFLETANKFERAANGFKRICESLKEENLALKIENRELKHRIDDLTPKPRGRPSKPKKVPRIGEALLGIRIKRKGGRPEKYSNAVVRITEWDAARKRLAKKHEKKSVTDSYLIKHMSGNDKSLSLDKRIKAEKEIHSFIKQLRDKTGVRIHKRKRKKAENPRV